MRLFITNIAPSDGLPPVRGDACVAPTPAAGLAHAIYPVELHHVAHLQFVKPIQVDTALVACSHILGIFLEAAQACHAPIEEDFTASQQPNLRGSGNLAIGHHTAANHLTLGPVSYTHLTLPTIYSV